MYEVYFCDLNYHRYYFSRVWTFVEASNNEYKQMETRKYTPNIINASFIYNRTCKCLLYWVFPRVSPLREQNANLYLCTVSFKVSMVPHSRKYVVVSLNSSKISFSVSSMQRGSYTKNWYKSPLLISASLNIHVL